MRIVCISDTHSKQSSISIPAGDVLVHAGDSTSQGKTHEIIALNDWLGTLPHKHKIIISGNHDFGFENGLSKLITNAVYLQDSEVIIDGVKFYGSPWQPWFFDWAFNLPRGKKLEEVWVKIPSDTDVLITHSPPMGILDKTSRGEHVGCEELTKQLKRVNPKLHVFGHIHEAYGVIKKDNTTFVNASICTLQYKPTNLPFVYDLAKT